MALRNVPEANGKSFPVYHLFLYLIDCKKDWSTEIGEATFIMVKGFLLSYAEMERGSKQKGFTVSK